MRHWLETFGAETHPFPTATAQVAMASKRTLVALTPAEKVRVLNLRSEAAAAMAAGVGNHWWPLDQSSRPQVDQASGVASGSSQTSGAHHASRTPAAGFIAAGPSGAAAGSSQTPAAGSDPETRNSSGAAEVGWRAVAESVGPTEDVSHGADQVVTLTPAEKMRVLNDAFEEGKELVVHFTACNKRDGRHILAGRMDVSSRLNPSSSDRYLLGFDVESMTMLGPAGVHAADGDGQPRSVDDGPEPEEAEEEAEHHDDEEAEEDHDDEDDDSEASSLGGRLRITMRRIAKLRRSQA